LLTVRYHDLTFDREMLSATRADGSQVRFTRQERALLLQLADRPGRLHSREHLVERLARDGADVGARNIDFLINRLRKRLGDSARNPRFIATQYGEGYIWIAGSAEQARAPAFLIIGPVFGVRPPGAREQSALQALTKSVEALLSGEQAVACQLDWRPSGIGSDSPAYSLDASFHIDENNELHAAFVLRHAPARRVIGAFRTKFTEDDFSRIATDIATRVTGAIWANVALPSGAIATSLDVPLEIRMHDAARMLSRTPASWRASERQLFEARAAKPHDPMLDVMWGLNQYARLLQHAMEPAGPMSEADWAAIEDEIETIALSSLPHVGDNPLLSLAVAKLIFFIDRGHTELAARLAEEAFAQSTAFAAAFALQGQIRMGQGEFIAALDLYDKAIEMAGRNSEFHLYLLVLKITALLASNEREALDRACVELFAIKPELRMQFGLVLASPRASCLPHDLEAMLAMLDAPRAQRLIHYFFNLTARPFRAVKHRRNVMQGLLTHMTRRFGEEIVPQSISDRLGSRPGKTA